MDKSLMNKSLNQLDLKTYSTLAHRLSLFQNTGRVAFYESDVLTESQWVNLFACFDFWPHYYDPLSNGLAVRDAQGFLEELQSRNEAYVKTMPNHDQLLNAIRQIA